MSTAQPETFSAELPETLTPSPQATRKESLSPEDKQEIKQLHQQWGSPVLRQQLNNVCAVACVATAIWSWYAGLWPLTVLAWIVGGHFFHTKPLSMHDASHGTLSPNRGRNELLGTLCGTASLVPLSVYRLAHAHHHGFMSSERDPEMWPFNRPGSSRLLRISCAFLEIVFGFLYTPLLFFRSLFVCGNVKKSVRKRIAFEYGLIAVYLGTLIGTVSYFGWWEPFLVGYVAPLMFAGAYQTLNKYTEHLGLLGDSVLSGTRTVIPQAGLHKTVSNMLQHVDHHGTHHRYALIPFYHLPQASPIVYGSETARNPVFPTYHAALLDMLPHLLDPKAGRQWIEWDANRAGHRPPGDPKQRDAAVADAT